jgi:hypothetical protein
MLQFANPKNLQSIFYHCPPRNPPRPPFYSDPSIPLVYETNGLKFWIEKHAVVGELDDVHVWLKWNHDVGEHYNVTTLDSVLASKPAKYSEWKREREMMDVADGRRVYHSAERVKLEDWEDNE